MKDSKVQASADTYICINGEFKRSSQPLIFHHNRALCFGDILYENMHAYATEPQFFEYHFKRLISHMHLLSMEVPVSFTRETLGALISQLLNKNRIFGGAVIRLSVFRNTGIDLLPDSHGVSFIIESRRLDHHHFELNEKGLTIDVFSNYTKASGLLSSIKNTNALLYLLACIDCKKNNLDDYLLLNENGRIVETTNSNIFLVSGSSIFTPGILQGCIPGVMREVIIEIAGKEGYRINDQSNLTPSALEDAGEIFLTNAVDGIRWVGAYKQRRYYKKTAKFLIDKLNRKAFR